MKVVTIYGLRDQMVPEIIRYVGMTDQVELREQHHRSVPTDGARRSYRLSWLRALRASGREPEFVVLQKLKVPNKTHRERTRPGSEMARLELQWIWKVQQDGGACLNREVLHSCRRKLGLKAKSHHEYLRLCTTAMVDRDLAAFRKTLDLERQYPEIFHVFRIGNLHDHIRTEEWPREIQAPRQPATFQRIGRLL